MQSKLGGMSPVLYYSMLASFTQHPGEDPGYLFDAATMTPLVRE